MLVLLLAVVSLCLLTSLIPLLYPYTIMNTLGVFVNHLLGGLLAETLGLHDTPLVAGSEGLYALTVQGVIAIYAPILVGILLILRGR